MPAANESQQRAIALLAGALDSLVAGDVRPWVEMFREDGVMEFPFAPAGYARRIAGRAALSNYLATFPDHFQIHRVVRFVAHPAADPHTVIVEFSVEGKAVQTGRPYNQMYVGVITLHERKIATYRDYWNPVIAIQAMGRDALQGFGNEERIS